MKKFIAFMLFGLFSFAVFTSSANTTKVKANTELSQMTITELTPTIVVDSNNAIVIVTEQSFGFVHNDNSFAMEVEARCNSPTDVQES